MKTLYISIFVFFSITMANGQFVFDATYNPKLGDKYNVTLLDTSYSEGKGGSNILWDFSKSASSIDQTLEFIAPKDAFTVIPKTTVIGWDGGDIYSFYQANNSSLTIVGNTIMYDNASNDMEYNNPQVLWTYPFKFNTENKDDFSSFGNIIFSGIQVKVYRNGKSLSTFDGFGSLKLDDKITAEAIRIKLVETFKDSLQFTSGIKKVYNINKTTYLFYLKNSRNPVIQVAYNKTDLSYLGSTSTTNTKLVMKSVVPNAMGTLDGENTANTVQYCSTESGIVVKNSNTTTYLVSTLDGKQLGVFQTTVGGDNSQILQLPQAKKWLLIQPMNGQGIGRICH